jgi:hypothetical protein
MTTIAACLIRRVMVADSQWSDGTQSGGCRKVFRIRGSLIGLCGDLAAGALWRELYAKDELAPGHGDVAEVFALRLSNAGLFTWNSAEGWLSLAEKRWAIGTGEEYAIGALMAGATPLRAVRIAITHDAGSGGKARTYRLNARR